MKKIYFNIKYLYYKYNGVIITNMAKELSEKSKEIQEYLKQGYPQYQLFKMGYPVSTVRYHHLKLNRPDKFSEFIKKVSKKQKLKNSKE